MPLAADADTFVRLEAAEDLGRLPVPEEAAPLSVARHHVPSVRGEVDLQHDSELRWHAGAERVAAEEPRQKNMLESAGEVSSFGCRVCKFQP